MNSNDFERKMRRGECYHDLKILPGLWTVLRVDGRSFSRFTESRFDKPFDVRFRDFMVTTAAALMESFHGVYAFTESDEISMLLPQNFDVFDRSVEKVVSLSAAAASAAFTLAIGEAVQFDSRIWCGVSVEDVVDYFRWRQSDATRCCLNGWCYWTQRNEGQSVADATKSLERLSVSAKNELLFQRGINFNEVPLWQRRGIGLSWETRESRASNPLTGESTIATRRQLKANFDLPMKDEYADYVRRFCDGLMLRP